VNTSDNTEFDLTDPDVIERLRAGDELVFNSLQRQLSQPLAQFISKRFNLCYQDAEEVAADVMVKVHEQIGVSYDPAKGSVKAWTFKIAINKGINRLEHQKSVDKKPEKDRWRTIRENRFKDSQNKYRLETLKDVFSSLSELDQSILRLSEIMSDAEIAAFEGVRIDVVRQHRYRALGYIDRECAVREKEKSE
jgi:RNA polymerase sigma factor (sigma-70 family)